MKLLTLARDLKRRKSREKQALFVAEGVRSVEELLSSAVKVRGVLVAPQLDGAERGAALRERIARSGHDVAAVTESEFRSAAGTDSPQGVLAIGQIPGHSLADLPTSGSIRILILDGLQDPGNTGTILRTAAALGVDATVALPGTVDLWNPKVVRGAMGASFRHPVMQVAAEELVTFTSEADIELWGAETGGDPVESATPPERLALAVGNEGAGLSSFLRERVARLVSLPITVAVESLNVAVAAGILLYQLRK